MFRAILFAVMCLTVISVSCQSQDFSMMSNWAQQQMLNDNLQRNLSNSGNGASHPTRRPPVYAVGPGIRTPHPAPSRTPIPAATTSYRPAPDVAIRVRGQFVDFIRKTSGSQAAIALNEEFQRKNYLALWAQHVIQDGLHPNDVADAFTAYWVENWQMANKVNYVPPARVQAVRSQVSATFSSNPAFARFTNAQKQEMSEIFIYNQIVQDANYTNALKRGDSATVQRLANASVARFRNEMHLNLRKVALTDAGFTLQK